MALSTEDRQRVTRGLMRYWSRIWETIDASKVELYTTVTETDAWIEDNQASYNSALTYSANFNAAQKTVIFCAVAAARVSIAFARQLFGEVD